MVPPVLCSPFLAPIGKIKMVLRIIHSTVRSFLFIEYPFLVSSIEGWTSDATDRTMLAFSSNPTIQLRLPAGTDSQSSVHLVVYIRDKLGCVTEFNLPPVVVVFDFAKIANLVEILQSTSDQINTHPFAKILANGDQNSIGQMISSLSQRFNQANHQSLRDAIASKTMRDELSSRTIILSF